MRLTNRIIFITNKANLMSKFVHPKSLSSPRGMLQDKWSKPRQRRRQTQVNLQFPDFPNLSNFLSQVVCLPHYSKQIGANLEWKQQPHPNTKDCTKHWSQKLKCQIKLQKYMASNSRYSNEFNSYCCLSNVCNVCNVYMYVFLEQSSYFKSW